MYYGDAFYHMGMEKTEMRIVVLWLSTITGIASQNLIGDHICRNKTHMSCCAGYVQVGNICVECEPGYFGFNCSSSCPTNHYGRRCHETCDCSSSEYCDVTRGCLCNETSPNCADSDTRDRLQEIVTKSTKILYKTVHTRNHHTSNTEFGRN